MKIAQVYEHLHFGKKRKEMSVCKKMNKPAACFIQIHILFNKYKHASDDLLVW